jgi:hypothetical protein
MITFLIAWIIVSIIVALRHSEIIAVIIIVAYWFFRKDLNN